MNKCDWIMVAIMNGVRAQLQTFQTVYAAYEHGGSYDIVGWFDFWKQKYFDDMDAFAQQSTQKIIRVIANQIEPRILAGDKSLSLEWAAIKDMASKVPNMVLEKGWLDQSPAEDRLLPNVTRLLANMTLHRRNTVVEIIPGTRGQKTSAEEELVAFADLRI